ncbi:MAG: OmpA family protein, partial [Rikenellaceae bacterium]
MKKIILLVAVGILSLSLTSYASGGRRDIKKDLKVSLNPKKISMVEKNGVVAIRFNIAVPRDYVHKKHQYVFTPVLTDYHNVMPLTSVVIDGKKYAKIAAKEGHSKKMKEKFKSAPDMSNAMKLMASRNPRMITYEELVPYQPWMQNADLVTVQRFNSKKATTLIAEEVYGKGVTVTPPPAPVVNNTKVEKIINKMEGKIKINFLINSSKIDPTLDSNIREMRNLKELIGSVMANKNNIVDSVIIIASSSPDGSYEFNKKLAAARAESVKNYLVQDLGVSAKAIGMIKTECIAENWEGLENLVNASNITNKPAV